MKAKKWILISSLLFILFISISLSFTFFLVRHGVPLRFSESLSYDAKLNFIHNERLLEGADTLVIGASMALSDVSGLTLQEDKKIQKVANISSWGLHCSDVLRQLNMIDLNNIKYIIFATQFLDFDDNRYCANINTERVQAFMAGKSSIISYFSTMETVLPQFMSYVRYKTLYMDPYTYEYLDFDKSGSALYRVNNFKIIQERWDDFKEQGCSLDNNSLKDLKNIAKLAKENKIDLIVITTPIREQVLKKYPKKVLCFKEYLKRMEQLSVKDSFQYLNIHQTLHLTDHYFVDKIHLNQDGAELVSKEILREL